MHAFENMLAPYAVSHLKVALELHNAGVGDSSMQILLTDTLDHRSAQGQFGTMKDPVAAEGERAADLKESERFTIVIGNPPYDREQRTVDDESRRKGGVVRYGAPGVAPRGLGRNPASRSSRRPRHGSSRPVPLLNDVTEPMRVAGLGRHIKNLYNDYIYFWRWAVWQATELPRGPGVVAFITASSYLDGVSMGGLRALLRDAFDEVWIIDLGGEGRGAPVEENIFDIRTPVAISIGISEKGEPSDDCVINYLRIGGTRAHKLAELGTIGLEDVSVKISGKSTDDLVPRSATEYHAWPRIVDLFPWVHSGSEIKRTWPIAETRDTLDRRWRTLVKELPRHRGGLLKETRDRTISSSPRPLLAGHSSLSPIKDLDLDDGPEGIVRYDYRSFDRQWIIADHRVGDYPRPALWKTRGLAQVFLTTLTSASRFGRGPTLIVSANVPDRNYFSGRGANIMPLYRDGNDGTFNVAEGLIPTLNATLGIRISAVDLLAYVYAFAGTPAFAERFAEELADAAGPIHIPTTADPTLFRQAVELGRNLLWWHTWGERFAVAGKTQLPPGRAQQVTPVEGMPEKFDYDPDTQLLTVGTGTFGPVSAEVWNFEVSGLNVVGSWLGYRMKTRKGRKSSPLDDIRPTRWTQTDELLRLLAILEHTIEVTPTASALLDEIRPCAVLWDEG